MRCERRRAPLLALLAIALLALGERRALAGAADYLPGNEGWNGLSSFCALARGMGLRPVALSTLDWDDLRPGDVLFVVYPRGAIDPEALFAFVSGGGRAVLADDFGDGAAAFARFGLTRRKVVAAGASRFEGRADLPLADPVEATSPLAQGVGALVTNHPAAFSLPLPEMAGAAQVIFAFDSSEALVVDEHVGDGRLVAIADPSVLINEMQAVPEDAAFATALLRELAGPALSLDPGGAPAAGRLLVLTQGFSVEGEPSPTRSASGAGGHHALPRELALAFNRWLDGLSDWAAQSAWLLLAALALVITAIVTLGLLVGWGRWSPALPTWGRVEPPRAFRSSAGASAERAIALLRSELAARLRSLGLADDAAIDPKRAGSAVANRAGLDAGQLTERLLEDLRRAVLRRATRRRLLANGQALLALLDLEEGA